MYSLLNVPNILKLNQDLPTIDNKVWLMNNFLYKIKCLQLKYIKICIEENPWIVLFVAGLNMYR
jgi:hypothetical protein